MKKMLFEFNGMKKSVREIDGKPVSVGVIREKIKKMGYKEVEPDTFVKDGSSLLCITVEEKHA